jgi:putative methionine-R-sulfoxide reductase with GAF domain
MPRASYREKYNKMKREFDRRLKDQERIIESLQKANRDIKRCV